MSYLRFKYMMILLRRSTRMSLRRPNSWNCLADAESKKIWLNQYWSVFCD